MEELNSLLKEIIGDDFIDAVISNRSDKNNKKSKVLLRNIELKGKRYVQITEYVANKVIHKNLSYEDTVQYMKETLEKEFKQCEVHHTEKNINILISKKGKVTIKTKLQTNCKNVDLSHNKTKNYLIPDGEPVDFLIELGVMNQDGYIIKAKYDKFRQINRFLEYINDIVDKLPSKRQISIIDFGCGSSYLTFAMYYFLRELKGLDVNITRLDLKEDLIVKCNKLACKLSYDNLKFENGDIADYTGCDSVDMVVTLHACDVATDYALAKAIQWNARVILSVPCCQHEVNRQIQNDLLQPVLKYGILKERMSALITDGIRAELLEKCGYDTQILEFIDMEHTPKNILIRAVRKHISLDNKQSNGDVFRLMEELHLNPKLKKLLDM